MAVSFSRTLRALDADRSSGLGWLQLMLGVCAALWCVWFFGARVKVFASASQARVEVADTSHRVQAQLSGYVIAVHAQLERSVERGDTLIELDASAQKRQVEQRLVERHAAQQQLAAVRQQIAAVSSVLASQRTAAELHSEEAALRQAQAEALAAVRDDERAANQQLFDRGAVAAAVAARSLSDADQQHREAGALSVTRKRIDADQRLAEAERMQRLSELRKEAAALDGTLASIAARMLELEEEIDKRRIRAPIAGRLGDVAPLTVGAFVRVGDELGMIIPKGALRIVAQFPPDEALGRIQPGQPGELRLFAFPWTQFGSVSGVVERVAQEVRDGRVRVELLIHEARAVRIPLQHGLPGSLQIAVDEASPASLAWRAAGRGFVPKPARQP